MGILATIIGLLREELQGGDCAQQISQSGAAGIGDATIISDTGRGGEK